MHVESSRAVRAARSLLRRRGFDVARFPENRPAHRIVTIIERLGVDLIVDVGANHGQFVAEPLVSGATTPVQSSEPAGEPRAALEQRARSVPGWRVLPTALGAAAGSAVLNVASNGAASSSILAAPHRRGAPEVVTTHTETVDQRRLDDVLAEEAPDASRIFLKLDVQGYEDRVLAGAERTLDRTVGLCVELSYEPLYEGAPDFETMHRRLADAGFRLAVVEPVFWGPEPGDLLAADGIYVRSPRRTVAAKAATGRAAQNGA